MIKYKLLFVILFLTSTIFSQAWIQNLPQNKSKSELTYFDYQNAFYSYWAPFNVVNGYYLVNGVKTKAIGWKRFKRWEYQMRSQINPTTGAFPEKTAGQVYTEFLASHPQQKSTSVANWKPAVSDSTGGGYAGIGRVNAIAFHPTDLNTFWVGSAGGGLWKTSNNGLDWTCLTDNIESLLISDVIIPSDYETSNTIYIATGDRDQAWLNYSIGVLKSVDGGLTWFSTGLTFSLSSYESVYKLLIDPNNNNTLLASTTNGVYKTTDGGTTWSDLLTTNQFIDLEYNPGNFSVLYGSTTNGNIFNSIDGGTTWSNVFSNGSCRRIELAVSIDEPTWVYAIAASNTSGLEGIYKSTDSGISFSQVFNGAVSNMLGYSADGTGVDGQADYTLTMAVSPLDANNIYIGGVNTWRSFNGGENWQLSSHWVGDGATAVHADKHFHGFRSNGDVFEGNDGGIYFLQAAGSIWKNKTNGISIGQMYKLSVSATVKNETITGLQDNGTKLLSDGKWSDVKGGDGMECLIDYSNENIQYGTYVNGQISRTSDHWSSSVEIQPADAGDGAWVTPFIINPTNPNILYAGYNEVWKTIDNGGSWDKISSFGTGSSILSMAIAPSNELVLYVATGSKIWKTTNGGTNWQVITGTLPVSTSEITAIAVKNDDPNTVWVTMSGYNSNKVFQSTVSSGATWVNISTGLPPLPVNTIVQNKYSFDEVHLFVGTEVGVYFKKGTNDWVAFNTNLPNVKIGELEIYYPSFTDSCVLKAATYGRGLWETYILISDTPVIGTASQDSPCLSSGNELILDYYNGNIQWQSSPNGSSDWTNVTTGTGYNSPIFHAQGYTSNTFFRVEVSKTGFAPLYSNVLSLYYVPTLTLAAFPKMCSTDAPLVLVQGLPVGGVYTGNGVVNGSFNPALVPSGLTVINYVYTSSSDCHATIYKSVLVENCSATKTFDGVDFLLYANPAKNSVKLFYNNKYTSMNLIDNAGKIVYTSELSLTATEKIIDVSKYANGFYTVELISESERIGTQLIIEN